MDTSYEEEAEAAPLISIAGIPSAVRDDRKPYEKRLAVYIILASTLCERIAFYTLAANLALNLEMQKDNIGPLSPSVFPFVFSGISYISSIIFAVISDAKLGRAKSIIVGFSVYLIGYILAILCTSGTIAACVNQNPLLSGSCATWIIGTVIIIAIGAGAVQSNMAVFGAEQMQESRITSRYFDKYMVVINISGIFAVWVMRFIFNKQDQTDNSYLYPCIAATSVLFFAALLFIIGRRYYIHVQPYDSVIMMCIPVVINAFQTWRQYQKNKHSIANNNRVSTQSNLLNASDSLSESVESISIDERPSTFLDFAKAVNHGKFHDRIVDDVKSLRSAFIVFSLLIPFWLIYNQLNSTFSLQANYMLSTNKDMVVYMWLGDPVTIIIGIPVLNIFVHKYLDNRDRSLTIVYKFVIGMCFAVITMCSAGVVETFRQQGCDNNQSLNQSSLILSAQLPQNIFMGVSEIFAMTASYEFAYYAAPRSAQTLFMSLRFCSLGISSFIGVGYMAVFASSSFTLDFSCPSKPDTRWRFFGYFFVLAGLQLIFIIIFIVCQKKFRIIKMNPQQMQRNQFLQHSSTTSTNRQ